MDLTVECEHIAVETKPDMIVFYCRKPKYIHIEETYVSNEDQPTL